MACLHLTDEIIWMIEKRKVPVSTFMDLSKAFDVIDHQTLLYIQTEILWKKRRGIENVEQLLTK